MNQHLPASKVVSSAGVPKLPELVHETGKVLNQRGSVSDGEFNLPGVIAVPLDLSKSKTSNVLEKSSGKNKEVIIAVPKTSNVLEKLNVS